MATLTGTTRAYLRISLDSERSGSIQKQRERLTAAEVAAGRDPGAVVWYLDEGVSGSKDVKRPGRDSLLAAVGKGDRVVVTRIDRLARNVRDLLDIVAHVEKVGAAIRFVDNDINTEGPYGRFTLTLLGAIAELEANIISERRRESLVSFRQNGRHAVGDLPFGFKSVPNGDGRGLVVALDPPNSDALLEAIERVMAGESQNVVRESVGMSKTGFSKLLRNPRLAGMTPEGEGVVMVNGTPRIDPDSQLLSLSAFRGLQEYLGQPDKSWSRQVGYGKVIACGQCGERMYINLSKRNVKYSSYRCRKAKHTDAMPGLSVMVDAANALVEEQFLKRYGKQAYTTVVYGESDAEKTEAVSLAETRIAEIERRMRGADREGRTALLAELGDAYEARDEAESLPVRKVSQTVSTGETLAEVWKRSDDGEREAMVARFGRFVVGGRRGMPLDERMLWEPLGDEGPGLSLDQLPGLFTVKE